MLTLTDRTYFCLTGEETVCLDIERDRFFCLGRRAGNALQRSEAGHSLTPAQHLLLDDLVRKGVLRDARATAAPISNLKSDASFLDEPPGPVRSRHVYRMVINLLRARHRLRRGLANGLMPLWQLKYARSSVENIVDERLVSEICGVHHWGELIFPVEENCLPRSIALVEHLLRAGQDARLTMGVMLRPFKAHCWAHSGSRLLNDRADNVRNFTPIMTL